MFSGSYHFCFSVDIKAKLLMDNSMIISYQKHVIYYNIPFYSMKSTRLNLVTLVYATFWCMHEKITFKNVKCLYCYINVFCSVLPISSSTRQHLVDSEYMEGMNSHSQVKRIFTTVFNQVLVGTNTASFQCLGRQLF